MTEYEQKAEDFLNKYNLGILVKLAPIQTPPPWHKSGEYGHKWEIQLCYSPTVHPIKTEGKPFPYWNSVSQLQKDKISGKFPTRPSNYDIIACLTNEYCTLDFDFEEFCDNYMFYMFYTFSKA